MYVGSSIDIEKRLKQHRWHLNRGTHVNRHLQAAWLKYGSAAFLFETVEIVETKALLIEREGWWIDNYATYNHIAPRRHDLSAETRAILRDQRLGKKMPESQRLALKAAVAGRKFPQTAYDNRWTPERRAVASALRKAEGGKVPRGTWTSERKAALVQRQQRMWEKPGYREKMIALRKAHPEWQLKSAQTRRQEVCRRGHRLVEGSFYQTSHNGKLGQRKCKECARIEAAANYLARKARMNNSVLY